MGVSTGPVAQTQCSQSPICPVSDRGSRRSSLLQRLERWHAGCTSV